MRSSVARCLIMLYPIAVYFGIQYVEPWKIAVILLFLIIIRSPIDKKSNMILLVIGSIFCALAIWNNNLITLRFYPVLINLIFLYLFVHSLYYPPPIIERIARLQHPDLPEQGVIYTRKVTKVWGLFFFVNGLIALFTAIWSSFAWWSLYNGFITYLLMGLLMAVEYLVRIKTQDHVC